MSTKRKVCGVTAILAALVATPLLAQAEPGQPDPMIAAAKEAADYMRGMITTAADQMSEEDYAFRPTPEVRSFGQLLAHVAEVNYRLCAAARGEAPPVRNLEATKTTRADIQRALDESFAYCDEAYANLTAASAKTMIQTSAGPRPVLALLIYRTHHAALHYGNVATYMRLRGRVPPSSQQMPTE